MAGISGFRASAGFSLPDNTLGYYKGDGEANRYGGSGSRKGNNMAGTSRTLNQTQSGAAGSSGWTPTTGYLIALVLVEVGLFGIVRGFASGGR